MQEINLAPIVQLRQDTPAASAPLPIHGVAPALRPYVPDAIPVPPEPQAKELSYAALAAKQRAAFFSDKDFVAKYQAGHVEADRLIKGLIRIEMSKNVPEEELKPFASRIGLHKPESVPDLPPPPSPLERADAKPSDFSFRFPQEMISSTAPEQVTANAQSAAAWAAEMKLPAGLGSSLIERIADVENKVRKMDYNALSAWDSEQNQQLFPKAGSKEAYDALKADAKRAITEIAPSHPWSKTDSAAFNDSFLVQSLANIWRARSQGKSR
jgi:hypothetical protein